MRPFAPRPITFLDVLSHAGWRLKRYAITYGAPVLDWTDFIPGVALALAELPAPARTPARAGVGFLVQHRGATADYVVLAWWDQENELPIRVVVRDHAPGATWRAARGSESFCVWDLQVIAFERDAYVATVLAEGDARAADAYLAAILPAVASANAGSAAREPAAAGRGR